MKLKNKIIRLKELREQLQVSKSTLWRWRLDPNFPKPILLGSRSVGFFASDIDAWLLKRKKMTEKGEL
ncbi:MULTISPECIES: AlpA family phage regulatory protein [unclassified Pseudoalteromonas]|uniref:helix-turn-helix transcriptional regulator n=1 Tax=unclassified Pseudoalteromonas TaxID=194690 RepID=UPI00110AFDFD|nr:MULTISPECIES: AlpA family phage regulatory protein [unclassified Pseudoalteromonas]MDC9510116.1 AlpA family phage regulatory protein [Pseudoalteromonas sp. Angola-4]TMP77770.1 AlpA family transcriptional regulator [Pseudoalteromonas sp. S983]